MVILAIANQKGGVAKTTTAVTIAHGLALHFKRVLLIDLDPQGNVADSLGFDSGGELNAWLNSGHFSPVQARSKLDIIRSDKTTANLKQSLTARGFAEYSISDALEDGRIQENYDVVILDCAPSLDILHVAAIMAATHMLIPTKLDQFSSKGVLDTLSSLSQLHRRGSHCSLAGVLPTFYDRTTNETQIQLESLAASAFGPKLYRPIPVDTTVRASNRSGQTLWEFAPRSRALVDGYIPALDRITELL